MNLLISKRMYVLTDTERTKNTSLSLVFFVLWIKIYIQFHVRCYSNLSEQLLFTDIARKHIHVEIYF